MSFSTNAETEILANLGILSNQHLSKKASRKESLNDSKETTNRTRLLSSSDLDKTSLNYDSEDEENMIVFNDLNSGTNNYLIKMSKTNKWQAFIVGLPVIFYMNYLISFLHLLPESYQEQLYKFVVPFIFGIGIGWYTSLKLFEKHNPIKIISLSVCLSFLLFICSITLTGFFQYIIVTIFVILSYYFIKGSLLILVSSLFDTKVYFLIFLFLTLGGLFAPLAISKSFIHVTSVELKSDRLLSKRETPTFLNSNIVEITTIPSTFNVNLTLNVTGNPLTKISKPDSVIGVSENQDKKTEENGLQRAAAEEKRKKEEEINGTLIKNITPTNIMTTNIVVTTLPSTTKLEYKTSLDTTVAKIETTKKEIITTTTVTTIKTIESTTKVISNKTNNIINETSVTAAPYSLKEYLAIDNNHILQITLFPVIIASAPSLFFWILDILKIKKLPNDVTFKYTESKTFKPVPIKATIFSNFIWILLSIIECTFSYCTFQNIYKNSYDILSFPLPMLAFIFVRFFGIFYCGKVVTKKLIHSLIVISMSYIVILLYFISNSNNISSNLYLMNSILGLLIASIAPLFFGWITKMVNKQIYSLFDQFIIAQIGSIFISKVVFQYSFKIADEGRIEISLHIIFMLLIFLEIFFTILSLHLSSYYRQNEIERLTNSLSGSCRKQNSDVSIKIKKSKHGYNRLNNDIDGSFDTLSLIDSDSDASNDEIFN